MKDNGYNSAFPVNQDDGSGLIITPGLTKRELFAAMAMQGFLSTPLEDSSDWSPGLLATSCVAHADALIEELSR